MKNFIQNLSYDALRVRDSELATIGTYVGDLICCDDEGEFWSDVGSALSCLDFSKGIYSESEREFLFCDLFGVLEYGTVMSDIQNNLVAYLQKIGSMLVTTGEAIEKSA